MKALVGGYWLQVCRKRVISRRADVNELLKNPTAIQSATSSAAFERLARIQAATPPSSRRAQSQQGPQEMKLTTAASAGRRHDQGAVWGGDDE